MTLSEIKAKLKRNENKLKKLISETEKLEKKKQTLTNEMQTLKKSVRKKKKGQPTMSEMKQREIASLIAKIKQLKNSKAITVNEKREYDKEITETQYLLDWKEQQWEKQLMK